MAWINGQWVEDKPVFGGMLGGFGGQDLGPRPPFVPPTGQQPIYGQGPQMQPSPYQPTQWAGPNATYPNWNDPAGPFANDVAIMNVGQPPPSQNVGWNTGAISSVPGAAALNAQAQSRVSPPPPQLRPPLSPPDISQYWPPGGDSIKPEIPTLGPEMIFDPPPGITIVDPPRRPEPPKKKVKKPMKKTRAEKTGYGKGPGGSRVPPTRPGRTQEGKGPKGPRTITGISRSQRGRGDR